MESSLFGRLFKGLFKFIFSSVAVGAISLVASTSFMTGKFPPDWAQIKNMFGTIQKVRDLQKTLKGGKGAGEAANLNIGALLNAENLSAEQIKQLAGTAGAQGSNSKTGTTTQNQNTKVKGFDDPEMAEVNDLLQSHENMRKLAANLNGENVESLPSHVGATNNNAVLPAHRPQQGGLPPAQGSTDGRIRALELQVDNLTLRLRELTSTLSDMNEKLNQMQRQRR
jgi:hypothetical protein